MKSNEIDISTKCTFSYLHRKCESRGFREKDHGKFSTSNTRKMEQSIFFVYTYRM